MKYKGQIEISQIEFYKQQAYELCDWADMLVLAPIDADTFAKMLHGFTDCLLLEVLRGWGYYQKDIVGTRNDDCYVGESDDKETTE